MPQPLSRFPQINITFIGGDSSLHGADFHPDLTMLLAKAVMSWASAEAIFLDLFVQLLGGDKELAADIFLALEIQSAKTVAINTAAGKLPQDQQRLLAALLALSKSRQKQRDKLVHWTWGYSPQLPDGLLLANPKHQALGENRERTFVYRPPDFREIIEGNNRLSVYALHFKFIVMGNPAADEIYARLCAEPEIQEKLNRPASPDRSPA